MSVKATKTRKRLIILVAAVVATAGAGGALWGLKVYRTNARFAQARETGMRAASEGRSAEAVSHLNYWLSRNPDDVEALRAYAKHRLTTEVMAENRDQRVWEAVTRLRHLVELRPNEEEPRKQLMELYMRYGLMTELGEAADAALKLDANNVEAIKAKLAALARLRKWDEALSLAERWAKLAPQDPEPTLQVLTVMAQADKASAEIQDRARKAGESNPTSPVSQMLMGVAYALTEDMPSARERLLKAAEQEPPTSEFARLLASQLNGVGLHAKSLEMLERLVKARPEDLEMRRALIWRKWEMGDGKEVVALTDKDADKLGYEAIAFRALSLRALGNTDGAREAMAQITKGKDDVVAEAWSTIVADHLDDASVDPRKLLEACQRAASKDSGGQYLHYYMGLAYAQLNEAPLAIKLWEQVATFNRTWAVPLLQLSELRLSKGRYALAAAAVQEAARRSESGAVAIQVAKVGTACVENGVTQDTEELFKLLSKIQSAAPQDESTLTLNITLMAKTGRVNEAKEAINKALSAEPALSEQALLRLATVCRTYDLGMGDECFKRSEQAHGLTATLAYVRAVHRFTRGAAAEGLQLLKADRERSGKSGNLDWELAWVRYLELTRDPGARAEWVRIADSRADDRQIQQMALTSPSARGDHAFIDRSIERLRKLTGDEGVNWKIARARWILDTAKTDQELARATILLKDVIRMSGDVVEPRMLQAQTYDRLNNLNGAIDELRVASNIDPANTQVALYLSQLLQKRGEFDKARTELDRLAKNRSADPAQRQQAAILLAQQGDAQRAIELLQDNAGEGKEGGDTLLLATLYRQRNEVAKAQQVVEKLLAKPDAQVVQFAADLYAEQGRRADADKVLAMLDKMELKPGVRDLLLADHAVRHGTPEQAVGHFGASLKAAPDNASTWRALIGYYGYLGRGKELGATLEEAVKAVPGDAPLKQIAAERELLVQGAAEPETRVLVNSFLSDPRPEAAPLAALRVIVASRTNKETPDQTAGKLRKIIEDNPSFGPLYSILSVRYIQIQRNAEAGELASRAVQMFPKDPEPARLAVEAMAASGSWGEAINFARTWRDRTPANPQPADMAMSLCLLRSNQPAKAAEILAPYVPAAVAKPDSGSQVIFQYTSALIAAGDADKAAEVLWPFAEKSGDWRKVWMQAALSHPMPSTATKWLERVETITPADSQDERSVLAGAWHMLGWKTKDQKATDKSKALFASLLARPDVTATTVVASGIVAEQAGDLSTAEAAYRRALTLDAKSLVAQNNLAMVILKKNGNPAEAIQLAKAAIEANPKAATLHDTLATAQAKGKDIDGAVASIRTAVSLEPNSIEWRLRLTRILLDAGRDKEATKAFDEIALLPASRTPLPEETQQLMKEIRTEISKKSVSQIQ